MDGSGISVPISAGEPPAAASDAAGAELAVAVDGLADLPATPVHTHAARYSDVHVLLQDALSDTDRGGADPR